MRALDAGIYLTLDEARAITKAILAANTLANQRGGRLPSMTLKLTADIISATGNTENHHPAPTETIEYERIDTAEAARILGCTNRNVRNLADRHRIPGHKVSGRWQFNRHDIEVYRDFS